MGGSDWSNALAVGHGSEELPRDPATYALWCAIAIGALLKGSPLEHVGCGIPNRCTLSQALLALSACCISCALDPCQSLTQHRFFLWACLVPGRGPFRFI